MAELVASRTTVVACTIVARNYLPAAQVLATSYLQHHPDHDFVIAVIDGDTAQSARTEGLGYRIVGVDAVGIDRSEFLRMATAYNVTELATSVKPFLLRELRATNPESTVIYLDPDIRVFAPMHELPELARTHQLVLTPHFLTPMPRDGKRPDEAAIMGAGLFNLGFLATGPGSEEFLDFWAERLRHDAIVAPERQLFTDQRWVDQVPALFRHHVLRDRGFNVAYWNLHERELSRRDDGKLAAGGTLLRFFHFSGYRPERPWLLSHHAADRPRVLLSEHPVLRELCDDYGKALREMGYAESLAEVPYGFACFADGEPLSASARRLFREGWIRAERDDEPPPPHAFGDDRGEGLREWLTTSADQAQAAAGLHRLALSVWQSRVDLQKAFPDPTGSDAAEFRHWCSTSGLRERVLPSWASVEDLPAVARPDADFGVNLVGYLTAELGVGEMGRIVYDAMERAGVDVVTVVEEEALLNRTGVLHPGEQGRPRFPVSLLAVNADQTKVVLSHHPEIAHQRYTIGLWAWELEDFPEWLHSAFDRVDEVWTVSDFCRAAIAEHSPVPVKTIPVPVRDPGEPTLARERGSSVRFFFAFDFNSVGDRKNPWGLVRAFQRAFPKRTDVRLVIKAINGARHPRDAERLRVLLADDDRIELIERYLSQAELDELYRTSDCYVSLHRSEGFGLTVAEAMARQLPVIATNYSGTAEFLDERTGWPIPYRMISVGEGNPPYDPDALWADPDLDAAAVAMREVADNPQEAGRRARAARDQVLVTRSMDAAAAWVRAELEKAYETWKLRRTASDADPAHPLQRLVESKQALHWRPDVSSPSRLPLAPAMRKAVNRALDHHDVHQRSVLAELMAGIEHASSQLLGRIEKLEARAALSEHVMEDVVRETVERSTAPLARRTARMADELRDVSKAVDDLNGLAHSTEHVSGALVGRLSNLEQRTHDMFYERDARADDAAAVVNDLRRGFTAFQQALRLRHVPIPEGADVVVCDAGVLLLPTDEVIWRWISYHRSWEPAEARLMARVMKRRPGAFIDVGAHVGYHTLKLLQLCPDVPAVIAVEADPTNFELLERNVTVNLPAAVAERISLLPIAAWDSDGVVTLQHADRTNSGDHRVRAPGDTGIDGIEVRSLRLEHAPEVLSTRVSVVKLDLQGADHRALDGLGEILLRDRPDVICEFSPSAISQLGDDPERVLVDYRKRSYDVLVVGDDGETASLSDSDVLAAAEVSESRYVTLWLRPV